MRVGERVAQDRLQDCAREGEVDPDERGDNRARQTDVPEDLRVRRVLRPAKDANDLRKRDVNRALCRREHHREYRESSKEDEQCYPLFHG